MLKLSLSYTGQYIIAIFLKSFYLILIATYTQIHREHFDKFKNLRKFGCVLNINVVLKME